MIEQIFTSLFEAAITVDRWLIGREQHLRDAIFDSSTTELSGQPWQIIERIIKFSQEERHLMIFGQTKIDATRRFLESTSCRPRIIIEFGTYIGVSTLAWGAILQELHGIDNHEDVKVFSFERDPAMAQIARDFIQLAGLGATVEIIVGDAADSLGSLVQQQRIGHADLVFFDHWEMMYLPDLKRCEQLKLLRPGTFIVADNIDIPGAPAYLEYVRRKYQEDPQAPRYETTTIRTGDDSGPREIEVTRVMEVEIRSYSEYEKKGEQQ